MDPEPMKQFDEHFKAWARRPSSTSAAEAAGQVLTRLAAQEETRPGPPRSWGMGTAVAALGIALVVGFLSFGHLPFLEDSTGSEFGFPEPSAVVSNLDTTPIPEGVALIWLDPTTPLYLTVDVPDAPEGGSAP